MKRLRGFNHICVFFLMAWGIWFAQCHQVYGEGKREEIVVGAHLPLTGILSQIGNEQRWAYESAVADINRKGGVYVGEYDRKLPVRLIILDDESSPAVVVAVVQRLISEYSVDFILSGHSAVHGVIPGSIVAEINKKYYHATGCFIQPWKEHSFQWSTLLFIDMEKLGTIPFELWQNQPEGDRPKRIALIMEDVYDGLAFGSVIRKKSAEYGYPVPIDTTLVDGIENYSQLIDRIKQENIDTILLYSSVADSIAFIRQLKHSNANLKYLFCWKGAWSVEFGKILGDDADNVLTDGHWSQDYPYPGAQELGARYTKAFGGASASIGAFYALAQVLWQAIEHAGALDPMLVRQAVLKGEFQTVLGTINYELDGVGLYPPIGFQWINGKHEVMYPSNLAHHKLQLPFSTEKN